MARNYTVQTKILRPVEEVFDAIVAREKTLQLLHKPGQQRSEGRL